jgi:outer membrane protein assembly factor BamB
MVGARFITKIVLFCKIRLILRIRNEMKMTCKFRKQLNNAFLIVILVISNLIVLSQYNNLSINARTSNDQIDPTTDYLPTRSSDYLFGIIYSWLEDFKVIGSAVVSDSLGNSYITGTINTDFLLNSDIFIGKTNSSGDIVWLETWDLQEKDIANDIVIDESNNQIFVIGETLVNTTFGYSDLLVVCFDSNTGEEIWNSTYGELDLSEEGNSAVYYSSKLYITGTQTTSFHLYYLPNVFSICIDSLNSSILWKNNNTNTSYDFSPSIVIDEDLEELILIFNRYVKISNDQLYRFHVRKLLLNGSVVWETVYGIDESIKINDAVYSKATDMIKITGQCNEDENPASIDAILLTLNSSGNIQQKIKVGRENIDESALAIISVNDSLYIGGYGTNEIRSNQASFLSKISLDGEIFWFEMITKFAISSINDLSIDSLERLIVVGSLKFDYDYLFERLLLAITKDSDSDRLSDSFEETIGTDPENPDTDSDGFTDGEEYLNYTDPLDAKSNPRSRLRMRNLAIALFILLIVSFLGIQFAINTFSRKTNANEKSSIVRLFEKIRSKLKRKKKE